MTGYGLVVTKSARREIKRLDRPVQERVAKALRRLVDTWPQSASVVRLTDIEPLEYRLRVGEWRVRFRVDTAGKLLTVVRVLPRGKAYER